MHVHCACGLNKYGTSKYPSGLTFMQAESNFGKISASHFQVLNTQNANANANMIPIMYLNENLMDCNVNLAWGKQEPLVNPNLFLYKTKGEKVVKTSFYILFL